VVGVVLWCCSADPDSRPRANADPERRGSRANGAASGVSPPEHKPVAEPDPKLVAAIRDYFGKYPDVVDHPAEVAQAFAKSTGSTAVATRPAVDAAIAAGR
jgi:hypothetical protein